jgi:hypothetical protein
MRLLATAALMRRGLRPSFADLLAASLIGWLFVAGHGWSALLADGDTGWHIRTGQWILEHRAVPTTDLFSFTRAGEPWFAWEWLSEVLFALVHGSFGLPGVTLLAGAVIGLTALIALRHMLWRGAHPLVALGLLLVSVGAASIHFLARPHIFTLLLMAGSLWLIERDRRNPGAAVWWLVPISAVWVNLHGGFFALPATLAVLATGFALEAWSDPAQRRARWRACRRSAALAAAVAAASLANPYGIALHRHVAGYLNSDWIRNAVDEFQSPRFRSENLLQYELLLIAGLMLAGWLVARKRWADALLVIFWAHLSLGAVRHVPLFALVAAPLAAEEASRMWERWAAGGSPRSLKCLLWSLGADLAGSFGRNSPWAAILSAGVILLTPAGRWPGDFPESKFPISLIRAESSRLRAARVFTSDEWGDYLIYRGWPRQKVFIDGRSDFYGAGIGGEYRSLIEGRDDWRKLLRKYDIGVVLAPRRGALAALLESDPGWRRIRDTALAVLYQREELRASAGANRAAGLGRY